MKGPFLKVIQSYKPLILICLIFVSISAFARENNRISYDKNLKALVAPRCMPVSMVFNGQKLNKEDDQVLKPSQTGEYSVQLIDDKGVSTFQRVLLSIDATGAVVTIYLIGDSTVCNYAASAYR